MTYGALPMQAATPLTSTHDATPTASANVALTAEVVRAIDLSKDQIAAWTEMRAATPAFDNPLLSPEFTLAVAKWRPDTRIAILKDRGRVVGFLPFQARPNGFARPVGAPFSDFHAIITAGPVEFTAREALQAAKISSFRFGCLIDPYNLFSAVATETLPCGRIEVAGDAGLAMDRLLQNSAQRFKRMRRIERKIAREIAAPVLTIGDQDPEAFAQIMRWKSAQYTAAGLHDVLQPAWVRGLMGDLFKTISAPLQGCMLTLRVNGKLIAGEFGVREGGALHPWVAAYDPTMALYSPGTMLRFLLIEAMPANGLRSYDLGPDAEGGYKAFFQITERLALEGSIDASTGGPRKMFVNVIPNARVRGVAARIFNRLDHVAAVEITTMGRARGVMRAVQGMRARLNAGPQEDVKEQS